MSVNVLKALFSKKLNITSKNQETQTINRKSENAITQDFNIKN